MQARWSPFVKQIVVVGSLVLFFWFLGRVHTLLAPLVFALLLAYLVSFPVGWVIRNTGWRRTTAVAIVYLFVIFILITAPVLLMPRLVSLFTALGLTLVNVITELSQTTPRPLEITRSFTIDLGPFYAPVSQWLKSVAQLDPNLPASWQSLLFPFASSAVVVVRGAVTSVIWTIFILSISFYVAKDAPAMGRFVASRVPEKLESEMDHLWGQLTMIWDAFVRGQILLGITMGTLVWILMSILGVRSSAALGLLAGVLEFVPAVGPPIAAGVAILIALVLGSTWLPLPNVWFAVLVAGSYFLLSEVENLYLVPRIVGRRVSLHPVVVIVAALAGAQLAGILGILLAAPTVASLRALFSYAMHKLLDEDPFPPSSAAADQEVFWRIQLRDHPIAALIFDLDGTLVEVNHQAVNRFAERLAFLRPWIPGYQPEFAARRYFIRADALANQLLTLLYELHLKQLVQRLDQWSLQVRGYQLPAGYVPIPGAAEALATLSQHYRLALVTGRSATDAARYLAASGTAHLFSAVITRDDVHLFPPHPAQINLAIKRIGVKPASCAVVSDSALDLRAAKAACARAVAVLSGFGVAAELGFGDLVIASVSELDCHLRPPAPAPAGQWPELAEPQRS